MAFSRQIIFFFSVPENLLDQASIICKITVEIIRSSNKTKDYVSAIFRSWSRLVPGAKLPVAKLPDVKLPQRSTQQVVSRKEPAPRNDKRLSQPIPGTSAKVSKGTRVSLGLQSPSQAIEPEPTVPQNEKRLSQPISGTSAKLSEVTSASIPIQCPSQDVKPEPPVQQKGKKLSQPIPGTSTKSLEDISASLPIQKSLSEDVKPELPVPKNVTLEEAMSSLEGKIYFNLVPMVLFYDDVAIQRCRKHCESLRGHSLLSLLNKMKAPKLLKDRARNLIRC
jgi:hypothetical protein